MNEAFYALLTPSLAGAVLSLILLLIRPLTKRFFSAAWHYYAWLGVFLVMVLPVRIKMPSAPVANEAVKIPVNIVSQNLSEAAFAVKAAPPVKSITIGALWITLAAAIFLLKIINYARFMAKVKRETESVVWPETMDSKVEVREGDNITSPFMAGLFRPRLIVPKVYGEERIFILLHEMTHYHRGDILIKWFAAFVSALHWFNPMVYVARFMMKNECELACDEATVRGMSFDEKKKYVETILSVASTGVCKSAPMTTAMAGSKRLLARRFIMIRENKKFGKAAKIISIALALMLFSAAVMAGGIMAGGADVQPGAPDEAFAWPVPDSFDISNTFNTRVHPITGEVREHDGIDIRAKEGADVVTAISGTVTSAGYSADLGNYVTITSEKTETLYAHLKNVNVEKGADVKKKDVIGKVGSTGMSTGSHLHFAVTKDGVKIDPLTLYEPEEVSTEVYVEAAQENNVDLDASEDVHLSIYRILSELDMTEGGLEYEIKSDKETDEGRQLYIEIRPNGDDSYSYLTVNFKSGDAKAVKSYYLEK